jgi:hypothetical protein
VIPALPADIPILPGQVTKARRRLPVGRIIVLVIVGLGALEWFNIYYSDYDRKQIDPVVTRAMFARLPKGTRLPVTVWSGPRILEIDTANVEYHGQIPTTCVEVKVIDPGTGALDRGVRYAPPITCIQGLRYPIR